MKRQRLNLVVQVLLVLVAALLGIVTNYATGEGKAPFLLELLQKGAVPAIGVLIVALIVMTALSVRLENPSAPTRVWDESRTPYPGLEAFAENEAAVFFGRDDQTTGLVRELHGEGRDRFMVIAGASGSGKSSLVQAGLIPRLRGRRWLVLPVISPGSDAVAALARALGEAGDLGRLRSDASSLNAMIEDLRSRQGRRHGRVLLPVDQLEELFTLSGPHEREIFLDALDTAVRADPRFWVVATVRIEFLRDFLDSGHAARFGRPVALGALTRADLATVIEAPGTLAGLRFAPGLVTRIVEDTGTSDALPLLAYLLQELYFAAGRGKVATFEDYSRLGGVAGALSRQADQVVTALRDEQGIEPILAVLFRFVTAEGAEVARRRVPLAELSAAERRIVDAFVEARLLVTDLSNGTAIAQVAHEALFRQWAPLRQEVEARAEQLRQRAELERWAADWEHSGRKVDYLLTGERLQLALQWLDALQAAGQTTDAIRLFVDASKRRDLVFLRRVSEGIGEYVLNNVEQYPELAILLSLGALSECPPTPAATRALMTALTFSHLTSVLAGHTDAVRNLSWSPDGRWIATASRDGTAGIWDCSTSTLVRLLTGHGDMVEMVAWSPDSARVATASRDRTVRVWDAATGGELAVLAECTDVIRCVAWSPDGRRIAAGCRDMVVRVWDTHSYELLHELRGHTDNILGIAFSPDGALLATGSHDRTVRIWNPADQAAWALEGHEDFVEGVSWSPDGQRIASAGGDGTTRIWRATDGQQLLLIRAHHARVWNVAWSPDGTRLATCGSDRTAKIWDPRNAEEAFALRGHLNDVWGVVWSPDGTRLATGSADTTARLWDVDPAGAEQTHLAGHRGAVRAVALSPSGLVAASGADDGVLRLWDVSTGRLLTALHAHREGISGVAWRPDADSGQVLLTCSADRTVGVWEFDPAAADRLSGRAVPYGNSIPETVVWSTTTRWDGRFAAAGHDRNIHIWEEAADRPAFTLSAHQDWVVGLSWSPRGGLLASTSDDRTARIWDLAGRVEKVTLRGHDNWVDSVSWSPDERRVVTGSADETARVWNTETGVQLAVLSGHQGRVAAVAWSPDGHLIATASYDRTVRIWDARTYSAIGVVGVHRDRLTCLAWTPDSTHVVTGSFDGTVRVWKVVADLDELKASARARVFRSLTNEERQAHLLPTTGADHST